VPPNRNKKKGREWHGTEQESKTSRSQHLRFGKCSTVVVSKNTILRYGTRTQNKCNVSILSNAFLLEVAAMHAHGSSVLCSLLVVVCQQFCRCKKIVTVPLDTVLVLQSTTFVVNIINSRRRRKLAKPSSTWFGF